MSLAAFNWEIMRCTLRSLIPLFRARVGMLGQQNPSSSAASASESRTNLTFGRSGICHAQFIAAMLISGYPFEPLFSDGPWAWLCHYRVVLPSGGAKDVLVALEVVQSR